MIERRDINRATGRATPWSAYRISTLPSRRRGGRRLRAHLTLRLHSYSFLLITCILGLRVHLTTTRPQCGRPLLVLTSDSGWTALRQR